MKILIVDDEDELSRMLKRYLKTKGFSDVITINTPEAAIQYIELNKPDFVFLDINLNTKLNGIDVLKQVHRTTPETLICMVSAYRDEHEQQSLSEGAKWFLRKPTTLDDLLAILKSAGQ